VRLVLILLALALGGPACAQQSTAPYAADGTLRLRLISPFPRPSILAASTRLFEEELERRLEGRLRVRAFYGGALVGPEETLEAIGRGVADAGTGLWIYAPGRLPLGSLEYRFVFNDPDFRNQARIKRRLFETNPALVAELAASNLAPPLLFGPLSPYLVLSREPIRRLADLRGKRIAFTPVEYVPVFRAAGAVPVLSPASEFYERLSFGVVDAVAVSVEIVHALRLHELAGHLLELALNTPAPLSVWVNLDYWRALTPADREHFEAAGRSAEARYLELLEEEVRRAQRGLREAGVRTTRLDDAALREWRAAIPPLARLWAERMDREGLPGSELVDAYVTLSAERLP
jgi:TRAP-type C4-dicarboxylate transport system substrate-binding protein